MAENATIEKPAVSPPVKLDLSKEIEQSTARQPDERVKVVRVFDDYYRCNWWVQDKSSDAYWFATGTIRRSSLLRATKAGAGLLVQEVPPTRKA